MLEHRDAIWYLVTLLNCGFYMEYILCATLLDYLLECFMDLYL